MSFQNKVRKMLTELINSQSVEKIAIIKLYIEIYKYVVWFIEFLDCDIARVKSVGFSDVFLLNL